MKSRQAMKIAIRWCWYGERRWNARTMQRVNKTLLRHCPMAAISMTNEKIHGRG